MNDSIWYRDREALALIARRYIPWLAVLNLGWEIAQLPLYTLWAESSPAHMAFAVAHCTAGDVLIGVGALTIALMVLRVQSVPKWRWLRISVVTAIAGAGYTIISEWTNTTLFRWAYSELMPTISAAGLQIGLSPLLQWLVLPPLSLYFAKRSTARL